MRDAQLGPGPPWDQALDKSKKAEEVLPSAMGQGMLGMGGALRKKRDYARRKSSRR